MITTTNLSVGAGEAQTSTSRQRATRASTSGARASRSMQNETVIATGPQTDALNQRLASHIESTNAERSPKSGSSCRSHIRINALP